MENWKPILDWINYEVSDRGRVRRGNRLLRTFLVRGYVAFNVSDGLRRRKALRVHREMLRAFVGVSNLPTRHLDGNKQNNRLSNLVYGSQFENEADKVRHGTAMKGERHHQAKITAAIVARIRSSNEGGAKVARQFGISHTHVINIRKRKTWA